VINRKYFYYVVHTTTKNVILYAVSPLSIQILVYWLNINVVSLILRLQSWPRDHLHRLRFSIYL